MKRFGETDPQTLHATQYMPAETAFALRAFPRGVYGCLPSFPQTGGPQAGTL